MSHLVHAVPLSRSCLEAIEAVLPWQLKTDGYSSSDVAIRRSVRPVLRDVAEGRLNIAGANSQRSDVI